MASKIATAALQYSKWLSRFICWIWAIYRFCVLVAAAIQPSAAEALASTLINLDWIMIINEGTYLINSLGEKYIYSDRFVLSWIKKGGVAAMVSKLSNATKVNSNNKETDEIEETEETEESGESNG